VGKLEGGEAIVGEVLGLVVGSWLGLALGLALGLVYSKLLKLYSR